VIESYDAGSMPFVGDFQKFLEGASNHGQTDNDSTEFFEKKVTEGFLDKVQTGIDVPNYPQFRDMNQMFFDVIGGIEKISGGYVETGALNLKEGKSRIPEASAIQNRSREIYEKIGEPFRLRICVTGPYTMSSFFAYKDKGTFTRLGDVLARIVENNVFSNKQGSVRLVSVDEPVFGFVDDPLLDRGSEGRENLLKAWESMTQEIRAKGAQACLHLHNTSDGLFWEAKALDIIESHVSDSFYQTRQTKERLESTDKFLKASIAVTDFDELIRNEITTEQKLSEFSLNEQVAQTWKNIAKKHTDPTIFLEKAELMKERLAKIVTYFGENRVPYAGPECALKSFPTYESALECLRRVSRAVKNS
jgi:5-methyltetrahydropteroyltriglutamate--homocysteine methyltransferase